MSAEERMAVRGHRSLRPRDRGHARVTYEELFFDLVYVFAVTQLSAKLLQSLTLAGLVETLILWFAVWLGWQYTCWATNWFDPTQPRIRALLFAGMLGALVMAAAVPGAFADKGLIFALSYAAIQVGRTAFLVLELGRDQPLRANYIRILGWVSIAAVFWIAGGLASYDARLALWAIAVLCEYVSPMFGFRLPGLGRSETSDWTIEGGHLAERCQLFVIVALGEGLLAIGATLAKTPAWDAAALSALLATFLGTLALWWLYFGTSSDDASRAIAHSADPGGMGAKLHYAHAILLGGIIATAVGHDLTLGHPHDKAKVAYALVLTMGPATVLVGSLLYRTIVYAAAPLSHVAGIAALLLLLAMASSLDILALSTATTVILLAVAIWESRRGRGRAATRT